MVMGCLALNIRTADLIKAEGKPGGQQLVNPVNRVPEFLNKSQTETLFHSGSGFQPRLTRSG